MRIPSIESLSVKIAKLERIVARGQIAQARLTELQVQRTSVAERETPEVLQARAAKLQAQIDRLQKRVASSVGFPVA